MRRTFRLIFLWLLILLPTLCRTHRSCQTPDKTSGKCVHFSSCRFVLQQYAMYKEHMPAHIMRFLQRARCRPKVDGLLVWLWSASTGDEDNDEDADDDVDDDDQDADDDSEDDDDDDDDNAAADEDDNGPANEQRG
ncbi:hypothetical protein AWZ03_002232 [Drosophila navojoa]|uniref:Clip domain-containing protein n=1 Tax=Drosophila navojoa TaxID=7232 RepID=A0A484BRL6_DRONA|nr:hypothetical protein AWZ03_002232 [Drosophila navojoa]